jgi:hypothetical protein
MKEFVLAGVLLVTPAHTQELPAPAKLKLADRMLGQWCLTDYFPRTKLFGVQKRYEPFKPTEGHRYCEDDPDETIFIGADNHYFRYLTECVLDKVEPYGEPNGEAYVVHVRCLVDGEEGPELIGGSQMIEYDNTIGKLIISDMAD